MFVEDIIKDMKIYKVKTIYELIVKKGIAF